MIQDLADSTLRRACIMDNSLFSRIQGSSEYLGFCFEEQEMASQKYWDSFNVSAQ